MPTPSKPSYRKSEYTAYINSPQWAKLKRKMPGERRCLACLSPDFLHLHHMYYPEDIWNTRHCHCCWLCRDCHEIFHGRFRGGMELPRETWEILRKRTRKIIIGLRNSIELPQAQAPKPKPRTAQSQLHALLNEAMKTPAIRRR